MTAHLAVSAGTDFFTVEVLTWRGLATYYVLFFIQLETLRVSLAGITRHPTEEWMTQMGRNTTDEACGCLRQCPWRWRPRAGCREHLNESSKGWCRELPRWPGPR
jgi:hypothetical protein